MPKAYVIEIRRYSAQRQMAKVARDLKYRSYSTDFTSLERELRGDEHVSAPSPDEVEPDVVDDQYADLASRYADYGEDSDIRRIG